MANQQRNLGMDTVRVEKKRLLKTLTENRDKHIEDYNESVLGYRDEVEGHLRQKLSELQDLSNEALVTFNFNSRLITPASHEDDYTVAIEMLKWSVDEWVDLSQHDFKSYVRDEWSWKATFNTVVGTYNNKAG